MAAGLPDAREQEIVDAVLAAPDDDGPRLVYADWLMERGDPRGELIAVQCARERLDREGLRASSEYRSALARERELLALHVKAWVDPVGLRRWHGSFSRGFITQLSISMSGLRAGWAHFARFPLRTIQLRASRRRGDGPIASKDLAWLAERPEAAQVASLWLESDTGSVELDWPAARSLAGVTAARPAGSAIWPPELALPVDPLRDAVRSLVLWRMTYAQAADLQERAPAGLRRLSVPADGLGADGVAKILDNPTLRGLRDLQISILDEPSSAAVLESPIRGRPRFPDLERLFLGARATVILASGPLAASRLLPKLVALEADVRLDPDLVAALDAKAERLVELVIRGPTADQGVGALARSGLASRLRSLTLVGADGGLYGPPSLMPLLGADLSRLGTLSLTNFLVGDANAEALASAAALREIVDLRLVRCGLTDARARVLARSPHLEALVSLDLRENGLSAAVLAHLRARWPQATVLG